MRIKPIYILTAILTLAAIYFYQDPEWNGNPRLAVVRSIVEQGTLKIDTYQAQPDWTSGDSAFFNGHYYLDKAPGTSLFAIPFYFVMYEVATVVGIALKTTFIKHSLTTLIIGTSFVINGLVMYQIARLMSPNSWKAFVASLAISLGTMLWPYSAVYYGHVPAAMFLSIAFYLLFLMNKSPEKINWIRFFWAGMALGLALLTDFTTSLVIAGLLVYALYVLRKQKFSGILKYGLAGALGAFIPLFLLFGWNYLTFGNPLILGYAYEKPSQTQTVGQLSGILTLRPKLGALYHITFDPQFGLFWQSPVLLLTLVGYFLAFKKKIYRAEILTSLYAVISMLLLNAAHDQWWSGHAFGPRYLIVSLPFFIIPLILLPDAFHWAVGILGVFSTIQMLIPLMGEIQIAIDWIASHNQFWIESKPFQGFSILWQYGLPLIFKSFRSGTPSWTLGYAIRLLPFRLYLSLPILIGAEAFLISLFYKQTKAESLQTVRNI